MVKKRQKSAPDGGASGDGRRLGKDVPPHISPVIFAAQLIRLAGGLEEAKELLDEAHQVAETINVERHPDVESAPTDGQLTLPTI